MVLASAENLSARTTSVGRMILTPLAAALASSDLASSSLSSSTSELQTDRRKRASLAEQRKDPLVLLHQRADAPSPPPPRTGAVPETEYGACKRRQEGSPLRDWGDKSVQPQETARAAARRAGRDGRRPHLPTLRPRALRKVKTMPPPMTSLSHFERSDSITPILDDTCGRAEAQCHQRPQSRIKRGRRMEERANVSCEICHWLESGQSVALS